MAFVSASPWSCRPWESDSHDPRQASHSRGNWPDAGASRLAGGSAVRHGPGESELTNIIYTSCPICRDSDRPPTWSLRARRAIQDRNTRTISYRGAVLEVSGVPDGDYVLDTTVDPTNRLLEEDKTNNCVAVRVRLTAMGTANPQAELLGAGPPCTH